MRIDECFAVYLFQVYYVVFFFFGRYKLCKRNTRKCTYVHITSETCFVKDAKGLLKILLSG